jgi:DNA modification methylase
MIELANAKVFFGSNLDVLPTLPDNSVDSIVTDPPYELGFMGKKWDSSGIAYSVKLWQECLRVLKPGGHLLSFGGTRTFHRMAVAIEDAGFEVRDSIAWLYGSGFPKSLDVSKAIDKAAGAKREVIGQRFDGMSETAMKPDKGWNANSMGATVDITAPATDEAKKWAGWGTALKPAFEPVVVARKPLVGTVAANVLEWGVGGLNIDGSRIGTTDKFGGGAKGKSGFAAGYDGDGWTAGSEQGRWPANIILDEYTAGLLDEQSEDASRFFYVSKANKKDRNDGLSHLEIKRPDTRTSTGMGTFEEKGVQPQRNFHPTVKPTSLMEYLVKLVTPPNGTVLDPFTGSGSTGKAALLNGYKFIGIELTAEYLPIIEGRLKHAAETYKQRSTEEEEKEKETLF